MAFGRKTLTEKLEDEVAGCTKTRTGLARRLAEIQAQADAVTTERRALLTGSAEPDEKALARCDSAARSTADRKASVEDAIATLDERIAAAQAGLAAERDRIERERVAGERSAVADRLADAGAKLDAAAAALATAYEAFRHAAYEALPPSTENAFTDGSWLIGETRGHLLHRLFPLTFTAPIDATTAGADAALKTALTRIRGAAEGIRTGADNVVELPRVSRHTPPPTFPEVVVALSRPAFFQTHLGQRIDIPHAGGWTVPEPIAAAAIAAGIGFGPGSPAGKSIIRATLAQPGARIEPDGAGGFMAVRHTGILGEGGKGLAPAPDPVDLGMLPDADGVVARAAE